MMSYNNHHHHHHHHHHAMGSGFMHVSSNIVDKMVSHQTTNSSNDVVRGEVDISVSSGEDIPVKSPHLTRECSFGPPLQETLDANDSGPTVDYMLPSNANITLQALERLMDDDDDDEISGSNHG